MQLGELPEVDAAAVTFGVDAEGEGVTGRRGEEGRRVSGRVARGCVWGVCAYLGGRGERGLCSCSHQLYCHCPPPTGRGSSRALARAARGVPAARPPPVRAPAGAGAPHRMMCATVAREKLRPPICSASCSSPAVSLPLRSRSIASNHCSAGGARHARGPGRGVCACVRRGRRRRRCGRAGDTCWQHSPLRRPHAPAAAAPASAARQARGPSPCWRRWPCSLPAGHRHRVRRTAAGATQVAEQQARAGPCTARRLACPGHRRRTHGSSGVWDAVGGRTVPGRLAVWLRPRLGSEWADAEKKLSNAAYECVPPPPAMVVWPETRPTLFPSTSPRAGGGLHLHRCSNNTAMSPAAVTHSSYEPRVLSVTPKLTWSLAAPARGEQGICETLLHHAPI